MVNSALKVAGDVLTMKQLLATFEEVKGKKLVEKRLGSVDDLTLNNSLFPYLSPYEGKARVAAVTKNLLFPPNRECKCT